MKKYLLGLIIFMLGITNVYALNVEVEDINISDHSNTITLGDYSITGNIINPDITFNKLNDYVTYEIKFKNNDKYTIKNITDDNPNEIMKTEYKHKDTLNDPIYITLTYINEAEQLGPENINITITLLNKKGEEEVLKVKLDKSNDILKTGPNTGIVLSITLSLISILLLGYLYLAYYRKKKNISTMILMLGLLLIPISIVVAESEEISLIIDKSNIKIYKNPLTIVSQSEEGTLSVGDELAVDTEHFYVVSSDEEKTVLLAKYNLYVGNICDTGETYWYKINKTLTSNDTGYGLQNSIAKGAVYYEMTQTIGTIPFSGTNYWDGNRCEYIGENYTCTGEHGLSNEYNGSYYGDPYPYIYNKDLSEIGPEYRYINGILRVQNNGYTIAYYVEEYIKRLKNIGLSNVSGRLMTYEEYETLSFEWLLSSAYWLGSAYTSDIPWNIDTIGVPEQGMYNNPYMYGVRPVIEVPTSDIDL